MMPKFLSVNEQHILRNSEKLHMSDQAIAEAMGIQRQTVTSVLHRHRQIRSSNTSIITHRLAGDMHVHTHRLSPKVMCKRLKWCHQNRSRDWTKIMFTDELILKNSTNLDTKLVTKRVMIWGGITIDGMLDLVIIDGLYNARNYIDTVLNTAVKPYLKSQPDLIYQHDAVAAHKAKLTETWFRDNHVQVLDWPPQSADLSIMETVWALLKKEIDTDITLFNRTQNNEFVQLVKEAWERLRFNQRNWLPQLYSDMKFRVQECGINNGGYTQ